MEQVYGINLKRRPDRRTELEYEVGLAGLRLNLVEAYDGSVESTYPVVGKFRNSREVACWKSHVKAWIQARADQTVWTLFVEDDILLVRASSRS